MTTRLENLETDVALLKRNAVHSAELLVDHSERLDRIQRSVDGLQRRFDGLEQRFDNLQQSLEGRLDRLIALTIEERTAQSARMGDIERRLSKLEERR